MSSGTNADVSQVGRGIRSGAINTNQDGAAPQLSSRQAQLDHLWKYYRCSNYNTRKYDWNGQEHHEKIEHESLAQGGVIPPGYYDAGQDSPLNFRKPSAPYYLAKIIVDRFTSMLFSAKRHPRLTSPDPATEDWLTGFAEATRLWSKLIQARRFGGAMGSVALSFKFVQGRPIVEVFDPRWCDVSFSDREALQVEQCEIRYQYSAEVRQEDGSWEQAAYWYRRVLTDETDTVWPKVEVTNDEPEWDRTKHSEVQHGLGFCPVVWVQNLPVLDELDGDPDCLGIYDLIEEIDKLLAQASLGTLSNCDPSLLLSSDAEWQNIKKGSSHALQVEKGGSASYLEISGAGIDKAMALAKEFEEKALTVASCVLDRNEGGPARSVEEIDHKYASMIDQADVLREQYGELGIKRLLEMVLRAARIKSKPRPISGEDGITRLIQEVVTLPKKVLTDENGKKTYQDRKLGSGDVVEVVWPEYFSVGTAEIVQRVTAAVQAHDGGLIDADHAIKFVAREFAVENVPEMVAKVKAEQQALTDAAMAQMNGPSPETAPPEPLADTETQEPLEDRSTQRSQTKRALRGF